MGCMYKASEATYTAHCNPEWSPRCQAQYAKLGNETAPSYNIHEPPTGKYSVVDGLNRLPTSSPPRVNGNESTGQLASSA